MLGSARTSDTMGSISGDLAQRQPANICTGCASQRKTTLGRPRILHTANPYGCARASSTIAQHTPPGHILSTSTKALRNAGQHCQHIKASPSLLEGPLRCPVRPPGRVDFARKALYFLYFRPTTPGPKFSLYRSSLCYAPVITLCFAIVPEPL